MAITYSFADNVSYGTEDVNNITARLVGAGIAPFAAKNSYSPSDLNALTAAVTSSGVSPNCCRCTKSGTAVSVAQGIIYFENGVTMEVDSEGFTVTVPQNTAGYVYAYYNDSLQTADIVFTAELPQTGYYVLLAEISAAGALTDRRTPARSKVATFGTNAAYEFTPTADETVLDLDTTKFTYLILTGNYAASGYFNYGVYNIKDRAWLYNISYSNNYWHGYIQANTAKFAVTVTSGRITIGADDRLRGAKLVLI